MSNNLRRIIPNLPTDNSGGTSGAGACGARRGARPLRRQRHPAQRARRLGGRERLPQRRRA